jgi:flagellar protein FliO/FliZ
VSRLIAVFLLMSSTAFADKANLLDVRSFSDKNAFVVEMKFDQPVTYSSNNTEYINETIQVNIPNGNLSKGVLQAKINNGQVATLYTYQADKDTLRSRIILRKGLKAEKFKGGVAVIPEGNILRVRMMDAEPKSTAQMLDAAPVLPAGLRSEIAQELKVTPETVAAVAVPSSPVETPAVAPAAAEEAKIPVLTKGKTKSMKPDSSLRNVVVAVFAVVAFAILMIFISRQWAKVGRKNLKANQIKVITQHYLAPRKSLAIIRVAGESILIGITDNAITPIKTLSLIDDEVPEELPSSFQGSMRQVEEAETRFSLPEPEPKPIARGVKAYANNQTVKRETADTNEEYSVKGIRDLVKSKLKDMRTI